MPQKKSYFALQLPKRWWIFGLDLALHGDIDVYQFKFFSELAMEKVKYCMLLHFYIYILYDLIYISYNLMSASYSLYCLMWLYLCNLYIIFCLFY